MSHSPVIGQNVPETTNGVDMPESPEIYDRPSPHTLKCDGKTLQEEDFQHEEKRTESEELIDKTHNTSNDSTPHLDLPCSDTHNPSPNALSSTFSHFHLSNTHTDSPPKHKVHVNEGHIEPAVSDANDSDLTDTQTKDRSTIQDTRTERQHDGLHVELNDVPVEDGVKKDEGGKETKKNEDTVDGEQRIGGNSETTQASTSTSQSSSSSSVQSHSHPPPPPPSTLAPSIGQRSPPDPAPCLAMPDPESYSDESPRPTHVMAEVRVRGMPERERVVRGMQDSKSLDELSGACGGGGGGHGSRGGGRGGQSEGRRATISSALELEGTVSHEGDLTNFICTNLEQKIKMSSRPSLDCDSDSSGPVRGRGSLRRPADIPPIDPSVLMDLQRHTQDVAQSVELMTRSLNGTIQNMTALSVGYIQTYRDSVDSLGESVDMSIKGMYTLMARCEELDRSMQPIHMLAAQIRDIKRTLDALEAICK